MHRPHQRQPSDLCIAAFERDYLPLLRDATFPGTKAVAIAATRATRRMVKLRDAAMVTCIILGVVMKSMGRQTERERTSTDA